jgi:hypothetical protein
MHGSARRIFAPNAGEDNAGLWLKRGILKLPPGCCLKFNLEIMPVKEKVEHTHFFSFLFLPKVQKSFLSGLPDFSWYKTPKMFKIYQIATKYDPKLDHMCIKYTNIFNFKTLPNGPKLAFLV